ncbi:hypothetical protein ATB93_03485 [Sphingomonas sp. WG]|nr:hypothetical protein ATB93_03485 [Sphingomonas sp. WG]
MLFLVAAALSPVPAGRALASGGGGGGGAAGLHLLAMDPIAVPIIDADRVSGTLNFKLVVEATDAAAAQRMTENLPALRMAAIASGVEFARLDASALRAVNVADLDKALTDAIHAVEPGVARVLIVEVGASQG